MSLGRLTGIGQGNGHRHNSSEFWARKEDKKANLAKWPRAGLIGLERGARAEEVLMGGGGGDGDSPSPEAFCLSRWPAAHK